MSMKKQWIVPLLIIWGLQPIKPIHAQSMATLLQQVSVDSLMLTVAHLSGYQSFTINGQQDSIWTRYSYSPQIAKARDYLKNRLERLGYGVTLDEFAIVGKALEAPLCQGWPPAPVNEAALTSIGKTSGTLYNVIAQKTGTLYPDQYYYITAHYDSRSETYESGLIYAPGADDNASGVATVVEAARVLAQADLPYSVRFALFAGEEQGLYGSRHHANAESAAGTQILGVINIDMIAYHHFQITNINTQLLRGNMDSSLELCNYIAQNARDWGFPYNAWNTNSVSQNSDHYPFDERGYPSVFISEDWQWSRNPYYHTIYDSYESLNPTYFHENAKLAIAALADLAGLEQNTAVAETPFQPQGFVLDTPYPNPFNPTVTLSYTTDGQTKVRIAVYNLLGQEVATLQDSPSSSGDHDLVWHGRDNNGETVPSGVYLVVAESGGTRWTRKIVFQK